MDYSKGLQDKDNEELAKERLLKLCKYMWDGGKIYEYEKENRKERQK